MLEESGKAGPRLLEEARAAILRLRLRLRRPRPLCLTAHSTGAVGLLSDSEEGWGIIRRPRADGGQSCSGLAVSRGHQGHLEMSLQTQVPAESHSGQKAGSMAESRSSVRLPLVPFDMDLQLCHILRLFLNYPDFKSMLKKKATSQYKLPSIEIICFCLFFF